MSGKRHLQRETITPDPQREQLFVRSMWMQDIIKHDEQKQKPSGKSIPRHCDEALTAGCAAAGSREGGGSSLHGYMHASRTRRR
mmetsp:Transcript_1943/g.3734  ORF Transcript_1943/g.3734 Transcript_1943/m.3734 type:complete len:84 (-) Transcript_1943:20-271(-)